MELHAHTRTLFGKKTKKLRAKGLIPAELFGHKVENQHLELSETEFSRVYAHAGSHAIIDVIIDDGKKVPVLISDTAFDPFSHRYIFADLHAVSMKEKIKAKIPFIWKGDAPATKQGFPLLKLVDEMEIEALPSNIPDSIEVSLGTLTSPGSAIHIKDLKLPKTVKIHTDPELVIAMIGEQTPEEKEPVVEEPQEPNTEEVREGDEKEE